MSEQPSVNIIIPTYRQADIVGRAIESAVLQKYDNLRIIVSDDASPDNTQQVVNEYYKKYPNRIIYRRNNENIGRVANYRQALYAYAEADWVVNLDGDDYYTDMNFISRALDAINKIGAADVLFYQESHSVKYGNHIKDRTFNMDASTKVLSAGEYFAEFGSLRYFSHMSTVYNRKLATTSGFYELNVLSSDIYSLMKLCLNNPTKKVILNKAISGYWVRDGITASGSRTLLDSIINSQVYWRLFFLHMSKTNIFLSIGWISALIYRFVHWRCFQCRRTRSRDSAH